ncbi:MAG: DUF2061 domain-containing protein [Betaproteobacteria bacterium]|jgi:uncharacterized membrane protein|nr:DUF2061 domain-containing protein [Betaproteobacteria bacterium]
MRHRIDPSLAKTLSFAAVHFTVAFTVGYLLTGSIVVGSVLALVEPACNTVAYHFHEKLWARRSSRNPGDTAGTAPGHA